MARLAADDWVAAAMALLSAGREPRIDAVAAQLGVTKGSFYWHFDGVNTFRTAVLTAWEAVGTLAIITQVDAGKDDPVDRISALAGLAFGHTPHDGLEGALRTWAAGHPEAEAIVARVDNQRLRYVTELLVAAGVSPELAEGRSAVLYRAMLGEWLWRSYGGAPLPQAALTDFVAALQRP